MTEGPETFSGAAEARILVFRKVTGALSVLGEEAGKV
jgi:hypothetical protein